MRGRLNLANGLHKCILHGNADIATRVAFAHFCQCPVIRLGHVARCRAHGQHEHLHPRIDIWKADVDSALESSPDGSIQLPGDVGSAQDQDTPRVLSDTVHLNEQFCFDTSRCLRFAFSTWPTQRIDFVNEDNSRLVLASHVKELLDESARICKPHASQRADTI